MPDFNRMIRDSVYLRFSRLHAIYPGLQKKLTRFSSTGLALILFLTTNMPAALAEIPGETGVAGWFGGGTQAIAGLTVIAGLTLVTCGLGVLFVRNRRRTKMSAQSGSAELSRMRATLDRAESMIAAQPGIAIVWEGDEAEVFGNPALTPGLPGTESGIIAYHDWLEPVSAENLAGRLEVLKINGEAFTANLVTRDGTTFIADGAVAGSRALLSLRSASETEQKNANLRQRCEMLEREVEASRALFEKLPAPVWISNPENHLDWVNPAYAASVGADDQSDAVAAGRSLFADDVQNQISQMAASNDAFSQTVPVEISGHALAYDVLAVPFSRGVIGLARDTRENDALRGNLTRLVETYARTMDQVETAVASYDSDGFLEFFNSSFVALWNLDEAWLKTRPHLGNILDRLRDEKRIPAHINYRKWKKEQLEPEDGFANQEQDWNLPNGQLIRILAGRHPYGTIYLYDDVTAHLQLETQHKTLVKTQRQLLDNLQEGAALFSSAGKLQLHNPAFARMWGLAAKHLANQPHIEKVFGEASKLHEDDVFWKALRASVTGLGDVRKTHEVRIERADETVLDCCAVPLPGGSTLITFTDVTDSAKAEQALIDRNRALEETDEIKSRFVQHVNYVLRAPLNTIIGYAGLLSLPVSGKLNKSQTEITGHIKTASDALLVIVDDILDLATMDAGAMELDLSQVDPGVVMAAAAAGVQDRLQQADVTLTIVEPEGDYSLYADRKRVQQVLFNLLTNAVEYSPEGSEVRLSCALEDGYMSFTVADQGPGIAPRAMSMIFEKFEAYQSGKGHRGPGLGLAMVKNLVELHNGEVIVESTPGKGAVFICRFPLEQIGTGAAG